MITVSMAHSTATPARLSLPLAGVAVADREQWKFGREMRPDLLVTVRGQRAVPVVAVRFN
jgi:hypothetical protein